MAALLDLHPTREVQGDESQREAATGSPRRSYTNSMPRFNEQCQVVTSQGVGRCRKALPTRNSVCRSILGTLFVALSATCNPPPPIPKPPTVAVVVVVVVLLKKSQFILESMPGRQMADIVKQGSKTQKRDLNGV